MYRPKTTIEQWRILQAVVDHGGYARAVAYLNKSQSSLNHAVAKLQTLLGIQLLEVRGRKAFLTEAGEVMLRRSRELTDSVQNLEELAGNIFQHWEPEITLVVDLAYDRTKLTPALKDFLPESRGSRLNILDSVLTGTEETILEHAADLVIAGNVPKGYLGEPIDEINFVAVTAPNHAITSLPNPIDPSALAKHLQIVIKDSGKLPKENSGWLKSENRWTVSHFDTAIQLLTQGIGFCWLPEHKVRHYINEDKLKLLNINGSSHKRLTTYLITPQPDNIGPGASMLKDIILAHRNLCL
ncbi:LysR family transcriptional regulator [Opacimonas viscosa]|uniref:LysR family transcriptional regulator n=1 Tax=Opacimonas viscosa TaxID=2961944 RepID=A0AA42BLF6_9ALTE|nr:LysR family transcriptional regulator [Opacimonas viscosa]MCP3428798.1 LysR family transcriptional regulator [Opacimonas viscosa]